MKRVIKRILFSRKTKTVLPGAGPAGFGRSRLPLAVAALAFYALGVIGCSNAGGEGDPSTLDGPSGLDKDNRFLFANRGKTELQSGLGTRRFEVSTDNEEAQSYFDQGLAQVYGFQGADAYRSFRKASESDPDLAMAHWGMALALGSDVNYGIDANRNRLAHESIQEAQSLADEATRKEQDYIAALATRYNDEESPDFDELNASYAEAMEGVADDYPNDPDAATLYAAALMWTNWGQQFPHPFPHSEMEDPEDTREVIETLQSVLERDPDHTGAIHYYIHVMEQSPEPKDALENAQRLKRLAPDSPHLVHMASHIYIHDGDYASIVNINEDVFPVLDEYRERVGEDDYFYVVEGSHERRFVVETLDRAGRSAEAVEKADELVEWAEPYMEQAPWLADNAAVPILTRVHFGKWDELHEPDTGTEHPASIGFYHFGRAMAYASTGRPEEAMQESDALEQVREQSPSDATLGSNSLDEMLEVVQFVADARIARSQEDHDTSIEFLREAVDMQDDLKYDIGYPIAPYSFRENLGAALLDAGQPEEAAKVFRDDLDLNPGNGRSWLGLAESLEAIGNRTGAEEAREEFDRAWRLADTQLRVEDY